MLITINRALQEGDSEGGLEEKGGVAYYESEGSDYGDEKKGGEIVGAMVWKEKYQDGDPW